MAGELPLSQRPIISATVAKQPISIMNCPPTGIPIRSIRTSGAIVSTRGSRERKYGFNTGHVKATSPITINHREITVAIAEPVAPSGGQPRCPLINVQSSRTLKRFARTITSTSGRRTCIACNP